MSLEPRQNVLVLLLGYAPVSLLHVINVFVDIKVTAAKYLAGSAGTGMEVCAQREHVCLNERTVLGSHRHFESLGRGNDRKCEGTPDWIPMFRH